MFQLLIIFFFCLFSLSSFSQSWAGLGDGLNQQAFVIYADSVDDLLYVGGQFSKAGNLPYAYGIAKWNGSFWDTLQAGISHQVNTIIRYKNEIYIAGYFVWAGIPNSYNLKSIAKWNGAQWVSIGDIKRDSVDPASVYKIKEFNNELFIVGSFYLVDTLQVNGLAKWDGNNWSDVYSIPHFNQDTSNPNLLFDITFYKGELYVAGNFEGLNGKRDIVKYNGTDWVDVGGGTVGSSQWISVMEVYNNELWAVPKIHFS